VDREALVERVFGQMRGRYYKTVFIETEIVLLTACVKYALGLSPTQLHETDWQRDLAAERLPGHTHEQLSLYMTMPTLIDFGGVTVQQSFNGVDEHALDFAAKFATESCTRGIVSFLRVLAYMMRDEGDQAYIWEQFGLAPVVAEYCASLAGEWEDSVWSLIDAAMRLSGD